MKELINEIAIDLLDKSESKIVDATVNSIQLFIKDKKIFFDEDGRSLGTDAFQWFTDQQFYKLFKIK